MKTQKQIDVVAADLIARAADIKKGQYGIWVHRFAGEVYRHRKIAVPRDDSRFEPIGGFLGDTAVVWPIGFSYSP